VKKLGRTSKATKAKSEQQTIIEAHKAQQIKNLAKIFGRPKRLKGKPIAKEPVETSEVEEEKLVQPENATGVLKEPTKAERAKQVRLKLASSIPSKHIPHQQDDNADVFPSCPSPFACLPVWILTRLCKTRMGMDSVYSAKWRSEVRG
jgi:hypothetical protein